MAALERTYKPVVNVSTDFLLSLTEYLPRNPLSLANWLKDGDPHAVTRLMCGSKSCSEAISFCGRKGLVRHV